MAKQRGETVIIRANVAASALRASVAVEIGGGGASVKTLINAR